MGSVNGVLYTVDDGHTLPHAISLDLVNFSFGEEEIDCRNVPAWETNTVPQTV